MEWNVDCTQLQLTHVTGTVQFRLNYFVYLCACYLTAEAYKYCSNASISKHGTVTSSSSEALLQFVVLQI